jgi:NADP-dependent 3-hydroxy acid dehydrogenase YdfG
MSRSQEQQLNGKVVLVTGASSGIGEAAARAFADAGACVVLAARRADRLEVLEREIAAAGGRAVAVPTDLEDRRQITRLVTRVLKRFGRIDVLANIAGWGKYLWLEDHSPEDVRRHFDVNVIGMAELTRQVLPAMQRQRAGHILNMSSIASRVAFPPMTLYAATKYAVEGLSEGLRRELAPWGIRVTVVYPGSVSGTQFNRRSRRRGGVPAGFLGLSRISRERVARELVRAVLEPKPEVHLGRLYSLAGWANRYTPALVDLAAWLYVRLRRFGRMSAPAHRLPPPADGAVQLPEPHGRSPRRLLAPLAAVATGALVLGSLWQLRGRSRWP